MYFGQFYTKSSEVMASPRGMSDPAISRPKADGSLDDVHHSRDDLADRENGRFPEVDDIVDRLSHDAKIVTLRAQTR
ncbi:hypothetical protein DFP92_102306 [Yoonia sediminilitoris]|uniref:Uncharacterized protein n=2 Tax=Yoonia sediminilitoris TaxID=1286148 RepID=A0A2T6KM80_9RHOB|nr:hypothetical protein C8N45_102306 [Yoonia sediminilitoris]RCW97589.1 hypothetical protein DFP92_102306 [Yoonia sediminilitoris]